MFFHKINPVLLEIGPLEIRYYGIIFALGFVIAYFLIKHLAKIKQLNITEDDVSDLIMYNIFGVVLGARLFEIIFYEPQYYLNNIIKVLYIWQGGLSFHGGLVGAFIATYYFSKKKKIHLYDILDILVIPGAIALFLGRLANLINAEIIGKVTDSSFCINYEQNPYLSNPPKGCRIPTQIFESLKNLFLFTILWNLKEKSLPKGFLFWTFVTGYGFLRTIIGFYKEQIGASLGIFTMGQLLSISMCLVGIFMLVRLKASK